MAKTSSKRITAAKPGKRLRSLDTYRGMIMVALAFNGFGLAATAANIIEAAQTAGTTPPRWSLETWREIGDQTTHVEWVGGSFWDMIQPSFMFMVGVAMCYSYAKRRDLGHSEFRMFLHACWRAVVLVALAVFLRSKNMDHIHWTFVDVLAQIGLGYVFLFLIWNCRLWMQGVVLVLILVGSWCLFYFGHAPPITPGSAEELGVSEQWVEEYLAWSEQHQQGLGPAWRKHTNVAARFEQWFLNQFPREERFQYQSGGYNTLNFIPALATMVIGVLCGEWLRTDRRPLLQVAGLLAAGCLLIGVGHLLHWTGVCPVIKRIWTPSFAVYSAGWCLIMLATLYAVIDGLGIGFWSLPFLVVGMNSISIYVMHSLLDPWVADRLQMLFGSDVFLHYGALFVPATRATAIGLVYFLICLWMYRQRIFVRI